MNVNCASECVKEGASSKLTLDKSDENYYVRFEKTRYLGKHDETLLNCLQI